MVLMVPGVFFGDGDANEAEISNHVDVFGDETKKARKGHGFDFFKEGYSQVSKEEFIFEDCLFGDKEFFEARFDIKDAFTFECSFEGCVDVDWVEVVLGEDGHLVR